MFIQWRTYLRPRQTHEALMSSWSVGMEAQYQPYSCSLRVNLIWTTVQSHSMGSTLSQRKRSLVWPVCRIPQSRWEDVLSKGISVPMLSLVGCSSSNLQRSSYKIASSPITRQVESWLTWQITHRPIWLIIKSSLARLLGSIFKERTHFLQLRKIKSNSVMHLVSNSLKMWLGLWLKIPWITIRQGSYLRTTRQLWRIIILMIHTIMELKSYLRMMIRMLIIDALLKLYKILSKEASRMVYWL